MFLIRQAGPDDFSGVYALARLLDSYNLPADRATIRQLLKLSQRSFSGQSARKEAQYLFVLEEVRGDRVSSARGHGKIIGASLIIAKHGSPGRPHLWFSLDTVTKYSRTIKRKRSHQVLRLGYTTNGPTEVGGLVVLPDYRAHPDHCGLQISYVRFLYMAMHPTRFEKEVLVEYRGAMGRGNRSPFWERIGKVFTGLPYHTADRLSVSNKEFISSLLPQEPIYCALLPQSVQEAIGAIHPAAQRAAHLLERIGFRPLPQIEPFDGGPYYAARRRLIRLIERTKRVRVASAASATAGRSVLVGTDKGGSFRALLVQGDLKKGWLSIRQEGLDLLHIQPGEWVYVCAVSR